MAMPADPLAGLFGKPQNADVPVVSVAAMVGGQVLTKSVGCTDQALFQAASISKAVAAFAALILVQDSKLVLDQDVNEKLVSWKLPPAQDVVAGPVTLRHLLCHSAGINVASFPGYPKAMTDLPALRQILDGEPMTFNCPVRRKGKPGTQTRYSGGGYVVLQQLIEDAVAATTKQTFAQFVTEKVFRPLGMTTATYAEPDLARAATGRAGRKEVPGGWRRYPEQAASGLWCTPSDLVRFAAGVQAAVAGKPGAILSRELAKDMLTVQLKTTPEKPGEPWGLGVELPGNDYFRHAGQNDGYICEFFATIGSGPAVAIMTASDHGNAEIHRLVPEICTCLRPGQPPYQARGEADHISLSASDPAAIKQRYAGKYKVDDTKENIELDVCGLRWTLTWPNRIAEVFEPTKENLAISSTRQADIDFSFDSGGHVEFLTLTEYVGPGRNIVITADPVDEQPKDKK